MADIDADFFADTVQVFHKNTLPVVKISLLGCGLAFMLALLSVSYGSVGPLAVPQTPAGPPKSEHDLRAVLRQTCDEVNRFAKAENFSILVSSAEPDRFELATDDYYNEKLAHFNAVDGTGVTAWMLATSGKYTWFHDSAVDNARYGSPKYETQPPPKWTEAHAIEVATKFADIFTKPWGMRLSKPAARFTWPNTDMDQKTHKLVWYEGTWEINWGELSSSGVPFDVGGVKVLLSEQFGPYEIDTEIGTSQYNDEHVTPIAQDKALSTARKELDATLVQGRADGTLPGAQLLPGEPTISLIIVQPFKCFHSPVTFPNSNFLKETKAHLAYAVTYQVTTSLQNSYGSFSVYIDAKDGSVLCCAYPPVYL